MTTYDSAERVGAEDADEDARLREDGALVAVDGEQVREDIDGVCSFVDGRHCLLILR